MPRDDWAKYARRDRARKAVREGTAFHSSFGGILKKPKLGKRRKKTKWSSGSRPNKRIRREGHKQTLCQACGHLRNVVDSNGFCNPCKSNGNAIRWLASQPATVNQRAQNQATSGLPQAGSPAVGTDRHDTLCHIPNRTNGVSSRGIPDRPLPSVCQQPSRTPTAAAGPGRIAPADATTSVSGTSRDEDTRETVRCKQPAGSAG